MVSFLTRMLTLFSTCRSFYHNTLFLVILLLPLFITLNLNYSLPIKVLCFAFFHISAILSLNHLAKKWHYPYELNLSNYNRILTPVGIFIISIVLVYAIFLRLLFSLLRYLRLGTTYNIITLLDTYFDHIIFLSFIIPFTTATSGATSRNHDPRQY